MGWFNHKLKKSVEKHLSVNGGECKKGLLTILGSIAGGDAKPMVAVSNRWPCVRGGEKDSLAIHSSDLTNPHLMRDKPIRVTVREENARDSNHFYNHNGEQTLHQAHSSVQAYNGVQPTLDCSRIKDRVFGTLPDSQSKERSGDKDAREDQMESEERCGSKAAFR